jgi:hypothetical protein
MSPGNHQNGQRIRKSKDRFTSLSLEILEIRACPAFCYAGLVDGYHTWDGTNGNDILNAIYAGPGGTIWYDVATQDCGWWAGPNPYDTCAMHWRIPSSSSLICPDRC